MPPQEVPENFFDYLKGLDFTSGSGSKGPFLGKNKYGDLGNYIAENQIFQDADYGAQNPGEMLEALMQAISGNTGVPGGSKPLAAPTKPGKLNTGYGEDQTAQFAGPTPPPPTPTPGPLQDFVGSISDPMGWAHSKFPDRSQGQYGKQPPAYRPQKERNIAREAFGADRAMKTRASAPRAPRRTTQKRTPLLRRSQVARNARSAGSGFRK